MHTKNNTMVGGLSGFVNFATRNVCSNIGDNQITII
jgi:hypothetical protein